jgi:large subunit ribosomal protein L31
MKANIHPKWNHAAQVTCACGNVITTGSQQDSFQVDICSACHPFFTGEMKFVDRQGRVDRFMQKMTVAQQKQAAQTAKKKDKKSDEQPAEEMDTNEPLSYKQILQKEQNKFKTSAQNKAAATKAA